VTGVLIERAARTQERIAARRVESKLRLEELRRLEELHRIEEAHKRALAAQQPAPARARPVRLHTPRSKPADPVAAFQAFRSGKPITEVATLLASSIEVANRFLDKVDMRLAFTMPSEVLRDIES
jgi:hypothetical protein